MYALILNLCNKVYEKYVEEEYFQIFAQIQVHKIISHFVAALLIIYRAQHYLYVPQHFNGSN